MMRAQSHHEMYAKDKGEFLVLMFENSAGGLTWVEIQFRRDEAIRVVRLARYLPAAFPASKAPYGGIPMCAGGGCDKWSAL